ncbi:hypothetical protein CEUSTIGMA_g3674.t1 [Chlamydomonas eustigma]|uniref:protein geranylgeranyltransferase type II n=1 Tax=Chlamydomonas eustigma TaxID=1157962 RepID=A0A250X0E2_9CHLO|nr:hypothetical protein CEUSTIGMA_g3674.t1 [Chlamydomonas eustigma]|eukprot:GAX76230.1 hypothetical protein CEUSTIGMA_g3674.t1 [Chlamydomonas eustigma]
MISDGFPVDSKPHFLDMLCLTSSEPCEPNRLIAGDETKQRKRGREDQPVSRLMDQALLALPEFAELHKPHNLEHVSDIVSGMEALDSLRSSKQMCSGSSSTLAQQIMLQIKKPTKLGGSSMSSNTVVGNSMSRKCSLSENVLNSTRISRKTSRSNSTSVTLDMGTEIESNINCTSGNLSKSASFSVILRPSSACSSLESPILGRVLELIDPAHAGRVGARTSTIIRSTVVSLDAPRGDERDGASYCLAPHVSGRDASQGLPSVHGNMTEVVASIGGGYVSSCKSPSKEYEGNENSGHQSGSTSSLSDGFRETEEGLLQPDPIHPHNLGASALNHSTSTNGVSSPALKQNTSFAAWEFHDDAIRSAYYSWQHDSFLDSARIALDLLNAPLDFPQFGNMTRISGAFVFPATQQQQSHGRMIMDHTPEDLGIRSKLLDNKHAEFIRGYTKLWENTDKIEFVATEHFWMSGMYWGLSALHLLGHENDVEEEAIISWVLSCKHSSGGFGGSPRNDPHLLYTLSAVQILALYNKLDLLDSEEISKYVTSLQQPDGSFAGDEWGEIDTRFTYCAFLCLSILGRLSCLNVEKGVDFIVRCKNFDGGFGCTPGNESHSGQVFTCIAALSLAGALEKVDQDLFCWWLCERQTPSGGMSGRPEKLQDVCYSWWCLSCLAILGKLHWIDQDALSRFILNCQDEEDGGISDRPEDMADVYHTFFGIAGLSLMGYPGLKAIDPTFALPVEVVKRIKSTSSSSL